MDTVREVSRWMAAAERITVLTGAGISTDSGIPDFRGPQGVWTTNPQAQRMFSLDDYVADRSVRVRAWRNRRDHAAWTARPNAGHRALVGLEEAGTLRALVTQNIDGLHQRAGSDPSVVIEIHGTVWRAECLGCGGRQAMCEVLARVDAGEEDPPCLDCGGLLKSATISFGQALRPEVWRAAVDAANECELFLAVGSSLQVHPAASLCDVALGAGARLVVVNAEPTPYDAAADAVVRVPISDVLPAMVASGVSGTVNRR
ncbi:MAG: SIR2 family NAD-dependent protein deacylase [Acidimicrobiales bacterium]